MSDEKEPVHEGASTSAPAAQTAPATPQGVGVDELDLLWSHVLSHWSDPVAHDDFVSACGERGDLPFAGNRYREHLVTHPADPLAERAKQRILARALVLLNLETKARRDWRETSKWIRAASVLVIVGALGAAILFLIRSPSGHGP